MAEKLKPCLMCRGNRVYYEYPAANTIKIGCPDCGLRYIQKWTKRFNKETLLKRMIDKWNSAIRPQTNEENSNSSESTDYSNHPCVKCGKEGNCDEKCPDEDSLPSGETNKAMPKLPTLEEVFAGLNYDGRNAAELNIGVGAGIRRCYDFIVGKIGNS